MLEMCKMIVVKKLGSLFFCKAEDVKMIELTNFKRSDYETLMTWIKSPQFLLLWGGPGFTYPPVKLTLNHINLFWNVI